MIYNIAIDGPAGAGKSTIARRVAKELAFVYVDTGAMYRAMALYLIRSGAGKEDVKEFGRLCQGADISIEYREGEQTVILNGENVTPVSADRRGGKYGFRFLGGSEGQRKAPGSSEKARRQYERSDGRKRHRDNDPSGR